MDAVEELSPAEQHLPDEAQRLRDMVAIVTGSARGIGRASAALFAAHGATVIGVDVDRKAGEEVAEALRRCFGDTRARFVAGDLARRDEIQRVADEVLASHPVIHILFNNVGATDGDGSTISNADPNTWDRVVALNLGSALWCTQAFLPGLRAAAGASVIHNASVDALLANPLLPLYSIAKGGLIPMTHTMAYEFADDGVRVNCLAPGGIETGMLAGLPVERRNRLLDAIPGRRFGTPMEVARVALFLASQDSSYVNGAVIPIESGRLALTPGTY